jgi:DNA-binding MarR family transcriptional regulator
VNYDFALLALQRATHTTLHRITGELSDLGLTASDINALANLGDGRPRTVTQLAADVGARPSTLTSMVDRLETRGHVRRRAAAGGDRRVIMIELTESGQAVADTVRQTYADLEQRALGGLSESAVAGFHEVLRALTGEPA